MKQFFKFMFASCLGSFLMIMAVSFIFIASFGAMVGSMVNSNKKTVVVANNSVLEIVLDKQIAERSKTEFESAFGGSSHGLNSLLLSINNAKNDPNIKGIYLKPGLFFDAGWATIEELRIAIKNFRQSGKFVYAYSDTYSQKAYYLTTACDSIFMNPSGNMELAGIAAEVLFIKDLLNKLDVDIELIRPKSNAYKSAGEMYILDKMSASNREQVRAYISSVWEHVSTEIANDRNTSVERINEIADNLTAYDQTIAIKENLLDELIFESEVRKYIAARCEKESPDQLSFVSANNYRNSIAPQTSKDKIALVYAGGEVKTGKGNLNDVYSDNITKAIEQAVKNDNVKAIVLRVNSPGGEVLGSEVMTNAIQKASTQKPLIVSMGDVAASAGYEISCYATKIVAHPTTLTGSIGVFGVAPNFGKMLKSKLGISFDTVTTNANSASLSTMRTLSPQAKNVLEKNVEDFYVTFCQRVAEGRNLTFAQVDEIARGRVWTGKQAIEIGLVDEIGGIGRALEIAASEAEIENYEVLEYPLQKDSFTQLRELLEESAYMKIMSKGTNKFYQYYTELEKISNLQGTQARLPFVLNY